MSTRSRNLCKESVDPRPVKRNLDFDSYGMETELVRAPTWKTTKSRRLDFGEIDPSVTDLLPDRIDFDSGNIAWYGEGRTFFTAEQKAELEAKFRREKYPSRKEKDVLAAKLEIGFAKIQTWFINRRRKWRKEQKKGAVGPSGSRPVLPGVSLIQTSCKRALKSTVKLCCHPQFPAQQQVSLQRLPSAPFQATPPFIPVSHHVVESFAAHPSGTQLYQQQAIPVPSPPASTETGPLPYQTVYPPFPHSGAEISQHVPLTNRLAQQIAVPSYPVHHLLHPENLVRLECNHVTVADSSRLTDVFPFSYSVAKELPRIFGDLENDDILDRPPTPSFELPPECEPVWDPFAVEFDQYHGNTARLTGEELTLCASAGYGPIQPISCNSCWYESNEMLSSSASLRELSRSSISKGRSFSFLRQA